MFFNTKEENNLLFLSLNLKVIFSILIIYFFDSIFLKISIKNKNRVLKCAAIEILCIKFFFLKIYFSELKSPSPIS